MRIPKEKILVREILPERNGIIITDRPEYKKGEVVVGSNTIEVGACVVFTSKGETIKENGEQLIMIKESTVLMSGEIAQKADNMKSVFQPSRKVHYKSS